MNLFHSSTNVKIPTNLHASFTFNQSTIPFTQNEDFRFQPKKSKKRHNRKFTKHAIMEKKLIHKKSIIHSSAVQQVNEATIVLRHFVELSAKLLPFLNELSKKELLLPKESEDRNRIIEVYTNYKFETSTSKILMDSPVLDLIQTAFEAIVDRLPNEESSADEILDQFFEEHEILVINWQQTDLN